MTHIPSQRAKNGRPSDFEAPIRWPSDDVIWEKREASFADWARALGVTDKTVRDEFRARGWERFSNVAKVRKAPCRHCGEKYRVEDDYPLRECHPCRGDRVEIQARLDAGERLTLHEERTLAMYRRMEAALA